METSVPLKCAVSISKPEMTPTAPNLIMHLVRNGRERHTTYTAKRNKEIDDERDWHHIEHSRSRAKQFTVELTNLESLQTLKSTPNKTILQKPRAY